MNTWFKTTVRNFGLILRQSVNEAHVETIVHERLKAISQQPLNSDALKVFYRGKTLNLIVDEWFLSLYETRTDDEVVQHIIDMGHIDRDFRSMFELVMGDAPWIDFNAFCAHQLISTLTPNVGSIVCQKGALGLKKLDRYVTRKVPSLPMEKLEHYVK